MCAYLITSVIVNNDLYNNINLYRDKRSAATEHCFRPLVSFYTNVILWRQMKYSLKLRSETE